jgi:MscS family membrane protein
VLDARLRARLTKISADAEGSRFDVLSPDRELVGTIDNRSGTVDVYVDRVARGRTPAIWLFSGETLDAIPALYDDVRAQQRETALPRFLTRTGMGGLRTLDWIVLLIGVPLFFVATGMLNRLLAPVARPLWRRLGAHDPAALRNLLPVPARLLLLAVTGRWLVSWLPLSLLVRQFWSVAAGVIVIVSVAWLLILMNGAIEELIRRRISSTGGATISLLRVVRRAADALFIFVGFIVLLSHFGINPTPALAGLGVGGLAVALAAQKTLENVIAGASLIFDQAVRVGDFLRMGTIEGTVDHIGLRSTRIRTLDRTVVSVPNGQIANVSLETLSERDKYWFHHEVRLRYDTRAEQLHAVLEGIRALLYAHPAIEQASVRVRFVRLGPFSFDIDVFAYVFARDWSHFLEIQEVLLFGITVAIERPGAGLALPAQTLYLTGREASDTAPAQVAAGVR